MDSQKSIYEYDNYRNYLKDQFERLKSENPKFSHRYFAKIAGLKSSSFLFSVMAGKANLSLATIENVSDALELDRNEAFYFKNLVLLNQATTPDERLLYAAQVLKSKAYRKTQPLAEATYMYFSHWYYVAIKELVGMEDFENDPKWISERLMDLISPAEAERAVAELVKLGMLKLDPSGKLIPVQEAVITPDEVTSAFAVTYHEELINLGSKSIRRFPRDDREISATTFRTSRENLEKVKGIIQRFRRELVYLLADEKGADGLYQINIQLFPLAPSPRLGQIPKPPKK